MPLSEHEQRLLEQMERQLYADDPRFASTMRGRGGGSGRRLVLAVLAGVVGLGLIVVGLVAEAPLVGVAGFALMLAGIVYALSKPRRGPQGVVGADGTTAPRPGRAGKPGRPARSRRSGTFMQRLEERWERRSRGDL